MKKVGELLAAAGGAVVIVFLPQSVYSHLQQQALILMLCS